MHLKRLLLASLLLGVTFFEAQGAISRNLLLRHQGFAFYTPHLINPKFFSIEIGFVTQKSIKRWNYPYHAFANLLIAEESYTTNDELRAGALGAKAGILLPTQPWIPLFVSSSFGFAKTALHHEPWFGKTEQTIEDKTLLLAEFGLLYRYGKKLLFKASYQFNTVDYFKRKTFLAIGLNF